MFIPVIPLLEKYQKGMQSNRSPENHQYDQQNLRPVLFLVQVMSDISIRDCIHT